MINETCLGADIKMIERRKLQKEDLEIEYTFYGISSESKRKYFALEIVLNDEASLVALGEDMDEAYSFYLKSINGEVTPCGLTEILADRINSIEY